LADGRGGRRGQDGWLSDGDKHVLPRLPSRLEEGDGSREKLKMNQMNLFPLFLSDNRYQVGDILVSTLKFCIFII
jgi:hypothetical protein